MAVIVVTNHVFCNTSISIQGHDYDFSNYELFMGLGAFARSFLNGFSVPIYFFIAGYVFFLGLNLTKETYFRKMHNRFNSLFLPYIMWNSLAIIMALVPFLPFLHGVFPNCNLSDLNINLRSLLSCFWIFHGFNNPDVDISLHFSSPIDGPLWFVRDLMIVAIFTPFINWTFKKFNAVLPIITGIVWFCLPDYLGAHAYKLVTAMFFFSIGAYVSFKKLDIVIIFKRFRICSYLIFPLASLLCLVCAYLVMSPAYVVENGFSGTWVVYVKNVAILSALPFAYNIAFWLIYGKNLDPSPLLSKASFFIYAAHMIILGYVLKLLALFIPLVSDIHVVIVYLLTDVILCLGLLGLYVFMRRYMPYILGLFTGGRV